MKKKLQYIIPASLLLLLFVGVSLSASAQQPSDFSNLTLEIATTKKEFIKLEPIPIIVSLSNQTSEPILGHTTMGFSDNHIKLFVSHEGGKMREIPQLSLLKKMLDVTPHNIEPGERHQSKELLTLYLDKIFPQPGAYQIQAIVYNARAKGKVKSNLLTVQILEPEGLDLEAFEYIKSKGNASFFFDGMSFDDSEKDQEIMETFVTNFGESAYADHAAFVVGKIYFYKKEYEKAREQFNKIGKKADFAFADKVSEYTNEINAKLRDSEKPK